MQAKRFMDICAYAMMAHDTYPRKPAKAWRKAGMGCIPYGVHPLWCATAIMQENSLPQDVRDRCAIALLLHDVLEDTTAPLPDDITPEERTLTHELTFYGGTGEEMELIWSKSDLALLCKAYDKASNLFDLSFMAEEKRIAYRAYALRLAEHIEKTWGNLVIVKLIRSLV